MSKPQVTLYQDPGSQPCRAVWAFLKINKIEHEVKLIQIIKGETKSPEYLKINPFGNVPCLTITVEGKTHTLLESAAILRFLANYFDCEEKWYPRKDLFRRAKIDWYLDWHHSNTRKVSGGTLYPEFVIPLLRKTGKDVPDVPSQRSSIPAVYKVIDEKLKESKFIAGDEISIADLILANEVSALNIINFDFSAYPNLFAYLKNVLSIPELVEVHAPYREYIEKFTEFKWQF